MDHWLRVSDFVLVLCTKTYLLRARGEEAPGVGLGIRWESAQVYRQIYEAAMSNEKFIPCLFTASDQAFIPDPLRSYQHYVVGDDSGYWKLYRRLTHQPDVTKPALGPSRALPPLEHRVAVPIASEYRRSGHRVLSGIGLIAMTATAILVFLHWSASTSPPRAGTYRCSVEGRELLDCRVVLAREPTLLMKARAEGVPNSFNGKVNCSRSFCSIDLTQSLGDNNPSPAGKLEITRKDGQNWEGIWKAQDRTVEFRRESTSRQAPDRVFAMRWLAQ
jgi:hypothetical protein